MWEKIKFWWTHTHEMECYGGDPNVTSSERWYWHRHGCWCGKMWTVLTNGCDLPEAQEAMRVRRNR